MVKRIMILLGLSLVLAGCAFIFGSPFPAYLPFVENMVDLSDKVGNVDPEWHEAYRLHLLNNFLFLTIEDQKLIILDSNLKVLQEYTGNYGRLGVYSPTAPDYFVGDEQYDVSFIDIGPNIYNSGGVGYYDPVFNGVLVFECDPSIGILSETGGGGGTASIAPGMNLEAIAYDDLAAMGYLFFRNWDGDSDEAQVISAFGTDLSGGGTIALLPSINLDVSDHDPEFNYTRDGYVVTTESKSQLFDLVNGEEIKAIYGGRVEQFSSAYDIDGNNFYYFNGENKTLYRCNTWW